MPGFLARFLPTPGLRRHIGPTLRLSVPVVIARAGLLLMLAVDTAMLGHYDVNSLASFAAANAVQFVMVLVAVGLLQSTAILVARNAGAGDLRACGALFRASLVLGLLLGVALALISLLGEWLLNLLGQPGEIAAGGGRVFLMFAWGMPGLCLWIACSFFLEGLSRPLPGMIVSLSAVLANALLDWLFIYGGLGLPPLGAEGAAIATSIVRWLMLLGLLAYIARLKDRAALDLGGTWRGLWPNIARLFRLGYPLGLSRGLEAGAFSALTLIAGQIGPLALAGYQITLNLASLVFMSAVGTGSATTVRVGTALGRRDLLEAARAGWAGVMVIAVVMALATIVFLLVPGGIASLYTDDEAVRALTTTLILITAAFLICDGAQMVLQGALRGMADVWVPSIIQFVAWWCVTLPLGYVLAVPGGLGSAGLIWAITAGATVSSITLALRFHRLTRRGLARA